MRGKFLLSLLVVIGLTVTGSVVEAKKIKLTFNFPVQVAGPLAKLMTNIVNDFNTQHPNIEVEPVYAGNYDQTMQKAVTAARGGNPPDVAVLLSIGLPTLLDLNMIENMDQFMIGPEANFTQKFYSAFMDNSVSRGKIWSIPFQRSTPIFYYNKEHFKEVGIDPNNPPKTWKELETAAKKLTKRDTSGKVVRWGFEDITDDTWTIQALILQAGGQYSNPEGTVAYFNTPEMKKAIRFWTRMANDERIMPRHRFYGAVAQDFVAGATSMMYNSTGSLSFVKKSAEFDFGVAPLAKDKVAAVPTGGGNLYILKGIPEEHKKAAWEFVKWMSQPEITARWSIGTGYIAVREDAFETEAMKEYVAGFPYVLVARDQLKNAYKEMAFHNNSQIREVLLTAQSNILDERVSIDKGLAQLQGEVDRILKPFQK